MLDTETKRRIDTARDILVGKIPDPKSQIEQITIAPIYKFMDEMDRKSEELGGKAKFLTGDYVKFSWSKLMDASLSGFELVNIYGEAIQSINPNPNLPKVQERIVEEIETYQKIIDGAKKVVESYKPSFKIDKNWEIIELSRISENLDGKRIPITKSNRKSGKYPYYGASGIVDYVNDFIFDEDLLLVSEDGANLRVRVTPIAFSVSGKIWVNNHAHALRFKHKATQIFVEYFLNSILLDNYITGSAQPKLNQTSLNKLKIPLPSLLAQKQIVAIEEEQKLVDSNKKLIEIFEKKIKDKITEVWGE